MPAFDYPGGLPVAIGLVKILQDRWGAEVKQYEGRPDGSVVVEVVLPPSSVAKVVAEVTDQPGHEGIPFV